MRIRIIAASNKQPDWVNAGFDQYAKRFRDGVTVELVAVSLSRRTPSGDIRAAVNDEGRRMLARVRSTDLVVAMSESGTAWRTGDLAGRLEDWLAIGAPVCVLIGGPDGLARACLERADLTWSVSPLTLPHGLVRVVAIESLYRAWSILRAHPYHRR